MLETRSSGLWRKPSWQPRPVTLTAVAVRLERKVCSPGLRYTLRDHSNLTYCGESDCLPVLWRRRRQRRKVYLCSVVLAHSVMWSPWMRVIQTKNQTTTSRWNSARLQRLCWSLVQSSPVRR